MRVYELLNEAMTPPRRTLAELTAIYGQEFATWFDGSKVKDRQGRPLLCFHSTVGDHKGIHSLMHFGTVQAAHERARLGAGDTDLGGGYGSLLGHPDVEPHLNRLAIVQQKDGA